MSALPSISLAALNSGAAKSEQNCLRECCETDGFFTLRETGLDIRSLGETIAASRSFFESDEALKAKFSQNRQVVIPRTSRGYVPLMGETLHPDSGPDRKQSFDFGIDRPLTGQYFVGPTLAPSDEEAPGFTRLHMDLQRHVLTAIVPTLLRSLAEGLGLPKDELAQYFQHPVLIHRVIYYPKLYGTAGRHTDNGILTILFQEPMEQPSLWVQRKGEWIAVPSDGAHIVVNLGDMLQKWTSGRYVSTPHKVEHNGGRSRVSIPFFVYPDIDAQLHPYDGTSPFRSRDVMLANFRSIWVSGAGAGRASEIV